MCCAECSRGAGAGRKPALTCPPGCRCECVAAHVSIRADGSVIACAAGMGCGYLAWNHARGIREARDRAREAPASRSASVAPPGGRGRRNASSPRFLARNRSSRRTCHECSCYKVSGSIRFSTSEPCAAASSFTRCLRAWRGIGRGGGGCCSLSRGWTHLGNSVRGVCRYYAPLRWVRKWDHGINCITKFFVVRIASRVCATCCCNSMLVSREKQGIRHTVASKAHACYLIRSLPS